MSTWLNHPRYIPVRDALIQRLRAPTYRFRGVGHVVFLCGALNSPARDRVRDYLATHHPNLLLFYADNVWSHIAERSDLGALQMEEYLADLADIVVVVVESPGTFAELGAFSISEPLRTKLLPILDVAYQGMGSFIETGPVRWINETSLYRPAIWADHARILGIIDELIERLGRITSRRTARLTDLAGSPKHTLLFLCDLIAVVQPVTEDILAFYMREIAGKKTVNDLGSLLGLGCAMGLIQTIKITTGPIDTLLYTRNAPERHLGRPYHHGRRLDLPSERARHVSVLQIIPEALQALNLARGAA